MDIIIIHFETTNNKITNILYKYGPIDNLKEEKTFKDIDELLAYITISELVITKNDKIFEYINLNINAERYLDFSHTETFYMDNYFSDPHETHKILFPTKKPTQNTCSKYEDIYYYIQNLKDSESNDMKISNHFVSSMEKLSDKIKTLSDEKDKFDNYHMFDKKRNTFLQTENNKLRNENKKLQDNYKTLLLSNKKLQDNYKTSLSLKKNYKLNMMI